MSSSTTTNGVSVRSSSDGDGAVARRTVAVPGARLVIDELGEGEPIVVVHGNDGGVFLAPFLERLAAERRVHLLHLPGWGVSELPDGVRKVDDLAHALLGLLDGYDEPVPVLGLQFGAWVAAEAAAWCDRSMSTLILVSPLGLRSGPPDERSFVDVFATSADELRARLYADPGRAPDLGALDDEGFLLLAQAQEAVARFGWAPYLNNPQLGPRLGRVRVPCLVVTGAEDGFVLEAGYPRPWLDQLGGETQHVVVDGVGHRLEDEAPDALVAALTGHLPPAA